VSDAIVGFTPSRRSRKHSRLRSRPWALIFPFTHNLGLLTQLCEDAQLALSQSLSEVDMLTPYAAQVRYGSAPAITVTRAAALDLASETTEWAAGVVKAPPSPDTRVDDRR